MKQAKNEQRARRADTDREQFSLVITALFESKFFFSA